MQRSMKLTKRYIHITYTYILLLLHVHMTYLHTYTHLHLQEIAIARSKGAEEPLLDSISIYTIDGKVPEVSHPGLRFEEEGGCILS